MQSQQKLLLTFQTAPRDMEYWGIQLCVEVYPRHNFEFTWLLVGYIWGYITHNSSIRSDEGLTPKALDLNSSSFSAWDPDRQGFLGTNQDCLLHYSFALNSNDCRWSNFQDKCKLSFWLTMTSVTVWARK